MDQELIEVSGRKVDLRRAGSGDPVLFLHSAFGEFWMPEFLEPLYKRFEVFSPAHPGFGDSTGIEEIADVEDMAFHYSDMLDALKLDQVHLIGVSLGGWIAAEVAVRWPDRVRSLILIDSVGIWIDQFPITQMWGVRDPQKLADLFFVDQSHPIAVMIASIDLDNPPPDEILLQFMNQQRATAQVGWDPYLHNPKLASRLNRINSPALLIWGEKDRLTSLEYGRRFAELIPGARFEVIRDAGHLAALEKPSEVAALAEEFLR
jgi:pimeloyl-ACP methyl ester carboxylesterase